MYGIFRDAVQIKTYESVLTSRGKKNFPSFQGVGGLEGGGGGQP